MNHNTFLKFAALFGAVFLLAACSWTSRSNENTSSDDDDSGYSDPVPETDDDEDEDSGDEPRDRFGEEYRVELSNFKFSLTTIEAQPGETISVKLVNTGGMHDFVIDELDVQSSTLQTGQEETIEIQIPEDVAGEEYEFYCSIGTHRAMGMKGVLRVSEEL